MQTLCSTHRAIIPSTFFRNDLDVDGRSTINMICFIQVYCMSNNTHRSIYMLELC
jgi:hypothetical protein